MSSQKKTLVIGASENPERYSYKAINLLLEYGHPVVAIGGREGQVSSVRFGKEKLNFENLDTVTLYLNPQRQPDYYDYIIKLRPQRVIFNPGTENPLFENRLKDAGIKVVEACTLVLLHTGQF
ncbi:MAG TPA: CoA-binding protein [Edaphocola sp.]|nr:CoA-binding protein [Edaphocola sp.]